MNEAPDPVFVKHDSFDKYLNLADDDKYVETYSKQIVNYFKNMGNKDYDYTKDLDIAIV